MERPKARLTIDQHQRAINASIWIDASPHEWPTIKEIPLLCNCILDQTEMVDFLQRTIAALRAELAAARLEIEALRVKPWQEQIEGQSAVISRLRYEKGVAEAEATALKAHVERLRKYMCDLKAEYERQGMNDAERKVTYKWSLSVIGSALSATPAQSLAAVKAEALSAMAQKLTAMNDHPIVLHVARIIQEDADKLQAEAANGPK